MFFISHRPCASARAGELHTVLSTEAGGAAAAAQPFAAEDLGLVKAAEALDVAEPGAAAGFGVEADAAQPVSDGQLAEAAALVGVHVGLDLSDVDRDPVRAA